MKKILIILFLVVIIALAVIGFRFLLNPRKAVRPTEEALPKIDYQKLERLESKITPAPPLSSSEAGFGREDPFAPY